MLVFKTNSGACIEWHVGEKIPVIFQPKRNLEYWPNGTEKEFPDTIYVVEVYADCHELDLIERQFINLPMPHKSRGGQWFGDMARFIHANMPRDF